MSTADAVLDQPGGLQGFAQQPGFLLQQQQQQQQQQGQPQPQQLQQLQQQQQQQQQQVAAVNANAVPGLPSIRSSCENFAKAMSTMVLLHEQNTELRSSLARLHQLYQSETTRLTQHTKQLESLVQQLQAQRDGARRESRELQTFIQKMQPEIEQVQRKRAAAGNPGLADGFAVPPTSLLEPRGSVTNLPGIDKPPGATTPGDQTPTALATGAGGGGGNPGATDPGKQQQLVAAGNPAGVPPQGLGSLKQLYLNFPMSSLEPALGVCRTASTRILQMFETLQVRKQREGSLLCHFCDHAFDDPLLFFIHQIFPAHVLRSDLAETFSTPTTTIKRVYPLERNELQAVAESMSLFKKLSSGVKSAPLVCDCCAKQTDEPQVFIGHARSQEHLTTVVATIANLYNQEGHEEGALFLRCILDLGLLLVQSTELMAAMRQGMSHNPNTQTQEQQAVTAAHMKVCRQYDEACCEVLAQATFNPADYVPRVGPEEAMRLLNPRIALAAGPARSPALPAPDAAAAAAVAGQPTAAGVAPSEQAGAAAAATGAAADAPAAEGGAEAPAAKQPGTPSAVTPAAAAAGAEGAEGAAAGAEGALGAAEGGEAPSAAAKPPAAAAGEAGSQQGTPASTPKAAATAAAPQQPGTPSSQAQPGTPSAADQTQAPAAAPGGAAPAADANASPKDPLRAMLSAAALQQQPSGAAAPGGAAPPGAPASTPDGARAGTPAADDGMRPLDLSTAFPAVAPGGMNPAGAPVARFAPSQVLQAGLAPALSVSAARSLVPASGAMMQMPSGGLPEGAQQLAQAQAQQLAQLQQQHHQQQQQAAQGLTSTGAQALNDLVKGTMHTPSPLSIFGQQGGAGGYGQAGGQLPALLQQHQQAQQQQQHQQQQAQQQAQAQQAQAQAQQAALQQHQQAQQQAQQHHLHQQQQQGYSMAQLLAASKAMDVHITPSRDPVVGHMGGLRNSVLGHQGGGGLEPSWLQQQQAAAAAQQQQQQQQAFQQQQQQRQLQLQQLQAQAQAQQQAQQQQQQQQLQQQQQQSLLGLQRANTLQQPQQLLQPANPQLQQLVQGGGAQQLLQPNDLNQLGQQQRNQALYGWPGSVLQMNPSNVQQLPGPYGN